MKKIALFFLVICSFLSEVRAQYSEFGISGGGSFYMGDLNPEIPFKQTMPAGGVFYRYNFNDRFSVKGAFSAGYLKADDAKSNAQAQVDRNLNFETWLFELAVTGEFNFFKYAPGDMQHPVTPFLFGGIAMFKFNPIATASDGNKYALMPLGTEGQGTAFYANRKKYSLVNGSVPFGLGLKANISKTFSVGLEWGMRFTFTDFLDDVSGIYADPNVVLTEKGYIAQELANRSTISNSEVTGRQRGNSKTNDWYSFALISLSVNIKAKPAKCPAYQ
ncbi:DUF6089 family protein [Bacteroidota bacterium]